MNQFPKNKEQGFTLIELLVVIAIIGLLSSIVLASLNSARMKARDVRRKADLHSLGLAIALYYDSTGAFPDNATTQGGDWPAGYKTQLAPYISKPPLDPLNSDSMNHFYGSYRMSWAPDPNCNGQYVLWMYFEGSDSDYGKYTCGFGGAHYFRVLGKY